MSLEPHPYADKFPMLGEAEHSELVDSIRSNGLRNPIVTDRDGRILDGRNRARACADVGIEPETMVYEGDDLAEYVIDCNVTRRNMSTGARAMSTALVLAEDGRRENGRWQYGALREIGESPESGTFVRAVRDAGVVLDYQPALASAVVAGDLALDAAFRRADEVRRSEESEKVLDRERKKREREEEKAEAERNAQMVADLTKAGASNYLELIDSGQMTPPAAWAAHLEDTRKERRDREELDRGRRDTCTRIAECVRFLDGGTDYAEVFLRDSYPHEQRFLAEGMWLTGERIDQCIDFLADVRKGLRSEQQ